MATTVVPPGPEIPCSAPIAVNFFGSESEGGEVTIFSTGMFGPNTGCKGSRTRISGVVYVSDVFFKYRNAAIKRDGGCSCIGGLARNRE